MLHDSLCEEWWVRSAVCTLPYAQVWVRSDQWQALCVLFGMWLPLHYNIKGALKFPLQTSTTCRGDWFDNILNWYPWPETYRFRATAISKQALPERTSRVSISNSFAIRPPAELHDEGCLGRIMWCQLTFISYYLSHEVWASFMCLSVLEQHGWVHFCWYTDMIFLYGEARGNGRAARRLYQDRFSQRPTPSHTLFAVIPQQLRERGTFTASRNNFGVPRRRSTPELEEAVGTMCATKMQVATPNRTCSGSEC